MSVLLLMTARKVLDPATFSKRLLLGVPYFSAYSLTVGRSQNDPFGSDRFQVTHPTGLAPLVRLRVRSGGSLCDF